MKHLPPRPGRHRPPPPGRRRAEPGRRKAVEPGPQHRGEVRPRYGRIAVALSSAAVTAVAVLGNFGVLLPDGDPRLAIANAGIEPDADLAADATAGASRDRSRDGADRGRLRQRGDVGRPTPDESGRTADAERSRVLEETDDPEETTEAPLPPASGAGLRVVFSESQQRVWLVEGDGTVARTYLASGSVYDNLDPGTYEVFSRSRYAVGIDDSGTMEYFVRFTHGDQGAAIGFHTIPVDDGEPVQTRAQLGTPLSHGCIRQAEPDAIALWEFAPIGTTVVVTP